MERTPAWLTRFRHLAVRWKRRADLYKAFALLACFLIGLRQIERGCWVL